jgi:hypothetical protein
MTLAHVWASLLDEGLPVDTCVRVDFFEASSRVEVYFALYGDWYEWVARLGLAVVPQEKNDDGSLHLHGAGSVVRLGREVRLSVRASGPRRPAVVPG